MKVESMNPVVRQLSQYASDKMFAAMRGNYKDFKSTEAFITNNEFLKRRKIE